jgi:hypothetical protein
MNTCQMISHLFNGAKITHDNWDNDYLHVVHNIMYDKDGNEVSCGEFVDLLYYFCNKGFHLWKKSEVKKQSTKDIKVGDIVAENSSWHPQFKVKFLNEDWVFLIPIGTFSGSRDSLSFRFEDWKDCTYKEFSFSKVKAE